MFFWFQQIIQLLRQILFNQEANTRQLDAIQKAQAVCCAKQTALLEEIYKYLTTPPPPPQPAGFRASLTITGELTMKKLAKVAPALNINDDGTATASVTFTDADGLPETSLTTYPPAVAAATVAASDATPGPSAFTVTPINPPASLGGGAFSVATISCVQPVAQPPAQGVDFQVSIASGLAGQTAPVSEDAGTLSIVADPNAIGGFAAVVTEP
jgi:hypothetical protein